MKFFFTLSNVSIQSPCIESINKKIGITFKERVINPRTYRVKEAIPTERRLFEQSSTFFNNTNLTSVSAFQKIPNDNQRVSLLQQLTQALDKGTDEFVEVIRSSQVQKEALKNNQIQTKLFESLKILTKYFSANKESYQNGSKKCNDEFSFDHFKIFNHLN